MKTIIKNTCILLGITLVAGVLLGFIYEVTASPRAAQAEKTRQAALSAVFDGAAAFVDVEDADIDAIAAYIQEKGVTNDVAKVVSVIEAEDASGELLGYIFTVDSYKGYGGLIEFLVGIQNDGTVNGYSLLSIGETVGLGMKAKDEPFASQFRGKNVDHFEYTKSGALSDNEIDAISGATITTRAMTNGMNAAIYAFDYITGKEE